MQYSKAKLNLRCHYFTFTSVKVISTMLSSCEGHSQTVISHLVPVFPTEDLHQCSLGLPALPTEFHVHGSEALVHHLF